MPNQSFIKCRSQSVQNTVVVESRKNRKQTARVGVPIQFQLSLWCGDKKTINRNMSLTQSELNSGRVKIGDVKEVAKQEFLELLEKFDGSKALIWDSDLTGPMGLIAEYSVIKEHKVITIVLFCIGIVTLPAVKQ